MKEFTITIEELAAQKFKVIADSVDEAIELDEKIYKDGVFVLESGEVQFKQMAVVDPCEETPEWIEF